MSAASTVASRSEPSLEAALDAFLAGAELAPSTRVYRQALEKLAGELEPVSLKALDVGHLEHAALRAWCDLGPATWNRNVAAPRTFLRWSLRDDELVDALHRHLARRREPADRTRAIPHAQLDIESRQRAAPREDAVAAALRDGRARR